METGHEKVQGTDYVYTVQGWIKGVNANTLDETKDPGKDATGYRPLVAKDVVAYSLHYNNFDYKAIAAGAGDFLADQAGSDLLAAGTQLYNGNIGQMVTTITNPTTRDVLPLGNGYKYDQLNRLKESKSFANLSGNSWGNAGSYDNKYFNQFTYDANGNILTQVRHDSTGTKIDDLAYKYERNFAGRLLRNRLYHVNDVVSSSLYSDDIDDMGTFEDDINFINTDNNYAYDGEGRLVKDKQEEIDSILWRVDGKVKMIIRTPASQKNNLSFEYDAMGRRTAKHVLTADNTLLSSTYYILDAQGNNMATYQMDIDTANSSLSYHLGERYIYGSSRLGMLKEKVNVLGSAYTDTQMDSVLHFIGNKQYEFSNHLGNVLSVISDKPVAHDNGGTVDYWMADIRSSYDYSPFGVMLTGRTFENSQAICEDSTINGASGTVLQEGFGSWSAWVPYKIIRSDEGPIGGAIETRLTYLSDEMQINADKGGNMGAHKTFTTGSGLHSVSFDITGNTCQTRISIIPVIYTPKIINVYIKDSVTNTIIASASYTTAGSYSLSFTPANAGMIYKIEFYMSNANLSCQFSVDNILITYQESSTTTVCKNVDNSYRYGFQNQERDDEISGKGNSYTAEFWQYDSRLGRRWNVDPVFKEYESPYATFANNPIWFVDPNGADSAKVGDKWYWKIEHGDDYGSISKKTGVNIDNLKDWNTQDPLKLESGTYLNLSNNGNIHFVYETKTPNIYQNTVNGLAQHPEWVNLNYLYPSGTEGNKQNRNAVCPPGSCAPGSSCDEFPYASTQQGGYGAVTMCVPTREQNIQGGQLSALYRTMNIGESFKVVPVPDDSKKQPEKYPILNPAWKPKEAPKPALKPISLPRNIEPVGGYPLILPAGRIVQAVKWILAF